MKFIRYDKICDLIRLSTMIPIVLIFILPALPARAASDVQTLDLSGQWELVIKMGFEGEGILFPLKIFDKNKVQEFNITIPVSETTIELKLEQYIPDLIWETSAVKYSGDGIAAQFNIKGKNLKQELWLGSANPAKQSLSSSIGGIAIKKLNNADTVQNLVQELIDSQVIGILSIWPEDNNVPFEYTIRVDTTINIPQSQYKLTILDYFPHYSIDTYSMKVVNLSDDPVNPAIKVAVDDETKIVEKWIWAKFLSLPHQEDNFPIRMQFIDFDFGKAEGRYFLIAVQGTTPWLLSKANGKRKIEKAIIGNPYFFTNEDYFFTIEKVIDGVILETKWKNKSEESLNPSLIITVKQDNISQQIAVEFNEPVHYKTDFGTMVLIFRRSP